MATIYFTLSAKIIGGKKQVMVRFGGTGVNQRAKSGIFVNYNYWDDITQGVSIPKPRLLTDDLIATIKELREADTKLRELRAFIEDEYISDTTAPLSDPNWLKDVVYAAFNKEEDIENLDFFGLWQLFIESKQVSPKRKQMYTVVNNMLQRYEAVKRKKNKGFVLDINAITPLTISDFEKFLYNEEEYAEKFPELYANTRCHKKRGGITRGRNTIAGRLEIFRTFYIWCIDKDFTKNDPFKKYNIKPAVYGSPIYITKEERDTLYHTDMGSDSLNAVRDIFVFQSLIGCRVGDLLSFSPKNVVNGAIEYVAHKTADKRPRTVRVPLSPTAKEIIAKYHNADSEKLLPFISEQKYNVYIKKCFRKANLTRMVTVVDHKTGEYIQSPLCDEATSHMARRNFIGTLYEQVKDPNLIAALSGHTDGSKSLARYRDIGEQMKQDLVNLLE